MTTENTNSKRSDVEEANAEQAPVSEIIPAPASPETITPTGVQTNEHVSDTFNFAEEPTAPTGVAAIEQEATGENVAFSFIDVAPIVEENVARPFTDFIEEFRLAEGVHFSSSPQEPSAEPTTSSMDEGASGARELISPWEFTPLVDEPSDFSVDESGKETGETGDILVPPASQKEQQASSFLRTEETTVADTTIQVPDKQAPSETAAPVSPLLRPPSRLRLPRHGGTRQREEQPARETVQAEPIPAPEAAPTQEQEQPRPARRYRFDRPAASAAVAPTSGHPRVEEGKEVTVRGPASISMPGQADSGSAINGETKGETGQSSSGHVVSPETPATNGNGAGAELPTVTDYNRHRRQGQERKREKEQATPAPVAEVATAVPEPSAPQTSEVAPEDLPPLEYSELQRASSRRRRRRRSGEAATQASPAPTANTSSAVRSTPPEIPTTPPQPPMVAGPRSVAQPPVAPAAASQYNIVSGYTVSQMNQSNDAGPFMSPEPSPARGSMPTRGSLRAVRPEVQRTTIYPVRTGDASMNQFANALVQAIQTQTDRMVNELRRAGQTPANVSVSLPALPSTERVGVFVDVANLLYSARTLRITIDFGKLLDFLRGNRRLVRAQAYCPTSPQSGEDQMFLQAVKGLGYRITTKNYKTFSSGAKKADLDLDLCMDVVRLVEGKAVDCIVLVSGDSDFMPMLDYCSDHGVRVEVAAFDEAMSATLRQSCDLFINLAKLEDIRA